MSIIDTLITDRTAADVTALSRLLKTPMEQWAHATIVGVTKVGDALESSGEYDAFMAGHKGAYNATDFNRVGEALIYLAEQIRAYGYDVTVAPRTDWTREELPDEEGTQAYLDEVRKIRAVLDMLPTTPEVPDDMRGFTFTEANAIEQILVDFQLLLERMVAAFRRCAAFMFIANQEPWPTAESYMGRTWAELDAMETTWRNWQVADWYLLLYGNMEAEGEVV